MRRSLAEILGTAVTIHVVDVGANPIDGPAPYASLLQRGYARVIGFDPNPDAVRRLNERKGPNETYLPYAVGDGREHTLTVCQAQGMTSLLEPNPEILTLFAKFPDWGKALGVAPVKTVRLDDVTEIARLDYLKMDIQGAELMVLQNATRLLSECLVADIEVEFLPLYRDQPLFSEVEQFMRSRGFWIHKFFPALQHRAFQPLVSADEAAANWGQLLASDAVFVRNLTRLDLLSPDELLKLAVIAADTYLSYDLAVRCLWLYDSKCGTALAETFVQAIMPNPPAAAPT